MKRVAILMGTVGLFVLAYMRCSQSEYRASIFEYQASEGCRDVHSCSSCKKTEKCDVTERDPEGWPIKRECCPK